MVARPSGRAREPAAASGATEGRIRSGYGDGQPAPRATLRDPGPGGRAAQGRT